MGRRLFFSAFIVILLFFSPSFALADSSASDEGVKTYEKLNDGIVEFPDIAKNFLTTPEQSLTYFVRKCREEDFEAAALALNLNILAPENQRTKGADLAEKLYRVMDRQTGFPFGALPDREDGYVPPPVTKESGSEKRYKGTFLLGNLPLEIGDFEIYLVRCQTEDLEPVWLFGTVTVGEIEEAYEEYGPRVWERKLPSWLGNTYVFRTPLWTWAILIISFLLSLGITQFILKGLNRFSEFGLLTKVRTGLIAFISSLVPYLTLGKSAPVPAIVKYLLLVVAFCSSVWIVSSVLHYFSIGLIRGELDSVKDLDGAGRSEDKRTLTYLSVGRRLLSFLVLTVGMAFLAMRIPHFESIGLGLLASAGVLSVLLGVAAQPIVGNFISGLQIGVTRPIRVGDSIHYEGTWCYVEDITFMYVMCRTWDEKRLVIPLRYFTSQPFKSDSLSDPKAMRTIEMKLDYNVDVAALRSKYEKVVKQSELWDEDHEPELEVLEFNDHTITVRATAWSKNASMAWKLHCQLREQLLDYLQSEQPYALPRRRYEGAGPVAEAKEKSQATLNGGA